MMIGILYISYDGMLEPLGQSQVISYLKSLSINRRIYLISFEKSRRSDNSLEWAYIEKILKNSDIIWYPLKYHKKPSAIATSWDIINGIFLGTYLIIRHRLKIIHARSYVAAVIALSIKKFTAAKFLFDMRGFWVDERIDGGIWLPNSLMYKIAKWFEKKFLLNADHVVSLTNASFKIINELDYLQKKLPLISVIPTCADLTKFRPFEEQNRYSDFVLGYVGSAGTWYEFDAVVTCFIKLRQIKKTAHLLIINNNAQSYIMERLQLANAPIEAVELIAVSHSEIPNQMARMDAGIFFYKQTYSRLACSPTKFGEFLGCGLPCLSNTGVGDMAEILENEKVGVALNSFDDNALINGIIKLLVLCEDSSTRWRCVEVAHKYFSLEDGVLKYSTIYKQLEESV